METQTIDQSATDARSSLMSSIQQGQDFSIFKNESIPSVSSPADTTLNNPTTDSRSESDASEPVLNQATSQPAKADATNKGEVATNPTDTKPQSRAPARIQELLDKDRASQSRIQELERKIQEKDNSGKKEEPNYLVPQPDAPKYTKDVLRQLQEKARKDGDQALFDSVQEEFEKWREHELKMIEWKLDNKEAVNKHNNTTEFYKQEALKQFKTLSDPNSEHTKQYLGIRGWMQKELPEMLKKPVSEFLLATISNWKLNSETSSARLVATETELKKAKEEIDKLKKGSMPLDSKTRTEVGSNTSPESSYKDAKESLMKGIRNANLGFGAQTM